MLSERQNQILKLIIEEYSKVPIPVGSTSICDILGVSPATVRSEMAKLEDFGYLEKTHTSSGRVPSENGYRYYVDNIMKPKKIKSSDAVELQRIFKNNTLEKTDAISKSLEIISEMTNYTTVMLGSKSSDNKLKQVEVVPINNENVIAIVITDKGHVENKSINIKGSNLEEVRKIVELINKIIVGTPIDEVSYRLECDIKPIISQYVTQYETLYNAFYNAFNDFKESNDIKMQGKSNILELPEFNTVDKIKNIVNVLDNENIISSIREDSNDINIYIGKESNIDDDLTVIKTKYNVNGDEGTIAILGPKRMEYDRVVSLLEFIKSNIES